DPSPYHWLSYLHDPETLETPSYPGLSLEDSRGRPRALRMGADWELVEGAFIRAAIEGPLTWLGLVTLGPSRDPITFALTRVGAQALELDDSIWGVEPLDPREEAGSLVVQPNFEI